MRKEIENWWNQAKDDLESAKVSHESKIYYLCVFMCQQAAEKALKALILFKKKDPSLPEMSSHSLIFIAKAVSTPREFQHILRELTPQYTLTRYPDVSGARPSELYDEETSKNLLAKSQELLKWIEKQLGQ